MSIPRNVLTLLVSLGSLACGSEGVAPPIEQSDAGQLSVPTRDREAGRQAFLDLKCVVCHRVAGEPDFPEPFGSMPGPRLDATLASRPAGYLATAITEPSHSISMSVSDEVKTAMTGVLSPMVDYSDIITVGQLQDLLAYLNSLPE